MPDWSYRTVLRPLLAAMGAERARRLAVGTLRMVSRLPLGKQGIDFLGHMRADPRLRTPFDATTLPGPIALGSMIDPAGEAIGALERFGIGLIEVGPVALRGNDAKPQWCVDYEGRTIGNAANERVVGVDELAANLARAKPSVPICVRIAETDERAIATILERLREHATVITDAIWVRGDNVEERVRSLRARQPDALIVAGGVTEPADARRLLDAGANVAAVDAGLVLSGPGLVKRCNEALLSAMPAPAPPEALTLDAARSAWFWALLLGVSMFAGGLLAFVIASTRIVLPYDERMAGLTRATIDAINPRLLPFMAHDRVSLAGTMMSVGIFYAALAWFGIRRGEHWAHVTVLVSAIVGFFSFFFFLGFGYFDPFHAFVTAILTQFTLLCMVMPLSPRQRPAAEWRETAAWRRGQWGQLTFIVIGAALTGAGAVISIIGMTSVFVQTDLEFLRTDPSHLRHSFEHLIPLVAHDRASLGGMLIANGVAIWLAAQWGFRAGARWLWTAFAWGGNIAFAAATIVHFVVGYGAILHLTPAILGWVAWNVALLLTRGWLAGQAAVTLPMAVSRSSSS